MKKTNGKIDKKTGDRPKEKIQKEEVKKDQEPIETRIISNTERIEKIKEIKKKERRKILILLVICFVLLITGVCIVSFVIPSISKVQTQETQEEKQKDKAVKVALKEFKELGEKDIKQEEIEVLKIQRKGELFYFISSKENTLEIRISDNKITRVNSVLVE